MQYIVREIHTFLIKSRRTIAIAESCTGGLLSKLLTEIPGSSKYFTLGLVCYSNKAKLKVLKVPSPIIAQKGAVSYEVAQAMAKSVRKLIKADIGIGVTGIAGPGGASEHKPLGTVFIAVHGKNSKICEKFSFTGNRATIRRKAALKALELLRKIQV